MNNLKRTGFITATLFLLFLAACGGGDDKGGGSLPYKPPIPDPVASISISGPASGKVGTPSTFYVTVLPTNTNFATDVPPEANCVKSGNTVTCTPTAMGVYYVTVITADKSKADTVRFTAFDNDSVNLPPGIGEDGASFSGMNKNGDMLVAFYDPITKKGKACVFNVLDDSDFCAPKVPDFADAGEDIYLFGINDNGDILGLCDIGYFLFLKAENIYQLLRDYGTETGETSYTGLNNDRLLVGDFADTNGYSIGFVYNYYSDDFDVIPPHPEADAGVCDNEPPCGTVLTGINNNGQMVGYYTDTSAFFHGFIYDSNSNDFIDIWHPDEDSINIQISGINDDGQVAGHFYSSDCVKGINCYASGFVYDDTGGFAPIDHPDAAANGHGTYVLGITYDGWITGSYYDGSNLQGFLLKNIF